LSLKNHTNDPIPTALAWFGPEFILKVNWTKPNCMSFYLAVRLTFILKIEPNRTMNTPNINPLKPPKILLQYSYLVPSNGQCFIFWRKMNSHFPPNVLYLFHLFLTFFHTFIPFLSKLTNKTLLKSTYYSEKVCFVILKYIYNESNGY